MARIVLTNVNVSVAGVDLSDHIASVSISSTWDAVETTAFAGGNVPAAARTRQAEKITDIRKTQFAFKLTPQSSPVHKFTRQTHT